MEPSITPQAQHSLLVAAHRAGRVIMEVRAAAGEAGVAARKKADKSLVTEADCAAESVILSALQDIMPGVAVISEEQASVGNRPELKQDEEFILVDPLDGTREFVGGSGDFTVNIGVIRQQRPFFGVVYAPDRGGLYWGGADNSGGAASAKYLRVRPEDDLPPMEHMTAAEIRCANVTAGALRAVSSRSHGSPKTDKLLEVLGVSECILAGSSVKFCRVAEGQADIYPRYGRTMLWDTAAGEAVLLAAGGVSVDLSGNALRYDPTREVLDNPRFIALGSRDLVAPVISAVNEIANGGAG